ncbi:hypothetical protein LCGC14_2825870, partial [marine sediment metagenome]
RTRRRLGSSALTASMAAMVRRNRSALIGLLHQVDEGVAGVCASTRGNQTPT